MSPPPNQNIIVRNSLLFARSSKRRRSARLVSSRSWIFLALSKYLIVETAVERTPVHPGTNSKFRQISVPGSQAAAWTTCMLKKVCHVIRRDLEITSLIRPSGEADVGLTPETEFAWWCNASLYRSVQFPSTFPPFPFVQKLMLERHLQKSIILRSAQGYHASLSLSSLSSMVFMFPAPGGETFSLGPDCCSTSAEARLLLISAASSVSS